MIERYSTPEMKNHFAEDSRFNYLLKVEIAVAKTQSEMKIIPKITRVKFSLIIGSTNQSNTFEST